MRALLTPPSLFHRSASPAPKQIASLLLVCGALIASAPAEPSPKPEAPKNKMSANATPTPEKKYTVPTDEELRKKLTPLQYAVTRENATERPYVNEYWRT